jgi:hypothetical protein
VERGENRDDAPEPAADVRKLESTDLGRCPRRPLHPEHPGARQVVEIVPRALREGPVFSITRQRADDEARASLPEHRRTGTQAIEHSGPELIEQHVVPPGDLQQRLLRALALEVEARAALVAVQREEHPRGVPHHRGHVPQIVARAGILDLVDLRAQVSEDERGERPRKEPRQVEHPNAGERAGRARHL